MNPFVNLALIPIPKVLFRLLTKHTLNRLHCGNRRLHCLCLNAIGMNQLFCVNIQAVYDEFLGFYIVGLEIHQTVGGGVFLDGDGFLEPGAEADYVVVL